MLKLRRRLADSGRRWIVTFGVVVLLWSVGSNAPLYAAAALAATAIRPLAEALAQRALVLPVTVVYALVGTLPVMLSRRLWWPSSWARAERSLPLARPTLRRSDAILALLIMAPWQGVLAAGVASVMTTSPDIPARDGTWRLLGSWLFAASGSFVLSTGWMAWVRARSGRVQSARAAPASAFDGRRSRVSSRRIDGRPWSAEKALVLMPLLRGRAPRSARWLGIGLPTAVLVATSPAWTALSLTWSLVLLATMTLGTTAVLANATRVEMQPLWTANRMLPIGRGCEFVRCLVALAPGIAGLFAMGVDASWTHATARTGALVAFVVAVTVGCCVEAVRRPAKQAGRVAFLLLTLVVAIACASEVAP